MDPVSALIASFKIPVGQWGRSFFTFLTTNFEWFFDAIADGVTWVLQSLIDLLLWLPPVVVVLLIAALAWWLQRSWKLAVAVAVGLAFIINQGLWKDTVETLVLVVGATAASMAIGVPIGIWAAHNERGYRILQPVLDLMQTMPTFVYLIPASVVRRVSSSPSSSRLRHPSASPISASPRCRSRCWRPAKLSGPRSVSFCGRWSCRRPCPPSWRASPNASCSLCRWW
jgi:glycine betaine/proline transport system permease protein